MNPRTGFQLAIRDRFHQSLARWYEVSSKRQRITSMEGLRGLAVLLVFFVHFHALFSDYVSRDSLSFAASRFLGIIGHSGVDLFFVISGYLIYGAVLEKRIRYTRFLRRRVQRIYPTFLSVLALYLILSAAFPDKSKMPGSPWATLTYIAANVFLLPGMLPIEPIMAVAWTLSYEFCFYLTIPIFVAVTGIRNWRRPSRVFFLTACLGLFLVGSFWMYTGHSRFALFLIGTLVFEAAGSQSFRMFLKPSGEIAAAVLFVLGLTATYLLNDYSGMALPARGVIRVVALCVSLFVFVVYSIAFEGFLRLSFCWTPIRWLGNMSYSYYLLHSLILQGLALAISKVVVPGPAAGLFWTLLPVSLLATLAASTALFLYIEKPLSLAAPRPTGRPAEPEYSTVQALSQRQQ